MFHCLYNNLKTYKWFWVGIVVILLVSIFEEEAVFDLSDWTVFQIIVVVLGVASIFYDNLWKYLSGQSLDLDRSTFIYGLIKSLIMLLYFGIIWFGFFLHSIEPLLIGVGDESVVVTYLYDMVVAQVMTVILLGLSVLFVRSIYVLSNHTSVNTLIAVGVVIIYVFTCASLFISSLRLLSKTPGMSIVENTNKVESSLSRLYSDSMSKDGYDWHTTVSRQVDFNFLDVAVFFWYVLCLILAVVVIVLFICFYYNFIVVALDTNVKSQYITKNLALYNIALIGFKHLALWMFLAIVVQSFMTVRCLLAV